MPQKALKGKHILITRSAKTSQAWARYLRHQGAIVHQFSTIETVPVSPAKKLADIFGNLGAFGWIIFTSPMGPYFTQRLIKNLGVKLPAKKLPPVAAIGRETARAARKFGWPVAFTPSVASSNALARELAPWHSSILLLRSDIASGALPKILKERGARVVDLAIYKTNILDKKPGAKLLNLLKNQTIDFIIFASPSAVKGFCRNIKGTFLKAAHQIPAIAIGPKVAATLDKAGFSNIKTAREATIKALKNVICS